MAEPFRWFRDRRRLLQVALEFAAILGLVWGSILITWGCLNNRFLDAVDRDLAARSNSDEERVLATFALVSDWRYLDLDRFGSRFARSMARLEHASPLHVSARTTLTAGTDLSGPCGAVSRSMVVLLRRANFQARKAFLYETEGCPQHTVVEVLLDGEWRVFDPTYRWHWTRPSDGEIATARDLRDPELLATILTEHPEYPLKIYNYDHVHHLRWEKVPGGRWTHDRLSDWLGEEWVRGIQVPRLYERPTFLAGTASSICGVVLLGISILLRRRNRRATGLALLSHPARASAGGAS